MTYQSILQDMLGRVPDDIDKREGSIIFDTLAPTALELAETYSNMDLLLIRTFADSSDGDDLERRVGDHGIKRKKASAAIRKGIFRTGQDEPFAVNIGSRFRLGDIVYKVIELIESGGYRLEAETKGVVGNRDFGALIPVEPVDGLGSAMLKDVLIPGEDVESDDSLRERFLDKVRLPATSGNASHYKIWAREVPGVGDAKVIPLWDGPGTVKVVVVDSDKQPATTALISLVSDHIEEVRPIGAAVSVVSASSKTLDVSAKLVLSSGYTIQNVQNEFTAALENYLESIAFTDSYLSYARIGTLLLGVPGVIDYTDLKINNGSANIPLADEEVAVLGAVELEV